MWDWRWPWPESLNSALPCSCRPGCSKASTHTHSEYTVKVREGCQTPIQGGWMRGWLFRAYHTSLCPGRSCYPPACCSGSRRGRSVGACRSWTACAPPPLLTSPKPTQKRTKKKKKNQPTLSHQLQPETAGLSWEEPELCWFKRVESRSSLRTCKHVSSCIASHPNMGGWVGGGALPGWNLHFFSSWLTASRCQHTYNSPQIFAPQTGASRYSGLFPLAGGPRWRGRPSEGSLHTRPSSWWERPCEDAALKSAPTPRLLRSDCI